jgi:hypothetical protein
MKHRIQIFNIKNYFKFITITNITLINELIYCAYNFSFATRMHHLPILDKYLLPEKIINSFAFKYFPNYEQEFLLACKACNNVLKFSEEYPNHEVVKISMGKEIIIYVYNQHDKNHMMEFEITDLSKFTGLCRRYKTPADVEKIIMAIFRKNND